MKKLKDVGGSLKEVWFKGIKAVGEGASNLADNAKFRLDEMNLENAREDCLGNISLTVYELWKRGVSFPQEVTTELEKLEKLDGELNDLRAEKLQADLARKGGAEEAEAPKADVFAEEPETEEPSAEVAQPDETEPAEAEPDEAPADDETTENG